MRPVFVFLVGDVELQQAVDNAVVAGGLLVQLAQQAAAVEALHGMHEGRYLPGLVGLEVADEVPLHVGGQLGLLGHHFLHPVLAKQPRPGLISLAQLRHGVRFGDDDQAGWRAF